ncbi:hypothetical protein D3C71_78530 [compost metagenome]
MNTLIIVWTLAVTSLHGQVVVLGTDIPSQGACNQAKRAYINALRTERHPAPGNATVTCSPVQKRLAER